MLFVILGSTDAHTGSGTFTLGKVEVLLYNAFPLQGLKAKIYVIYVTSKIVD